MSSHFLSDKDFAEEVKRRGREKFEEDFGGGDRPLEEDEVTDEEIQQLVDKFGEDEVNKILNAGFITQGGEERFADNAVEHLLAGSRRDKGTEFVTGSGGGEVGVPNTKQIFGNNQRPSFNELNESLVLVEGDKDKPRSERISRRDARTVALAALKPRIGLAAERRARQRSTQQERARAAGASQTQSTSASGLFDTAHLARRQLTGRNKLFQ